MYAMPPTSATQVSRLTNWPANSGARPEPAPLPPRGAGAVPHPVPNDLEHRPLGDHCHPPAHLRIDDDPHRAHEHRPDQLVPESRSGLGVEHQVANVDEPADRRQHTEGDLKDLHPSSSILVALSAMWPNRVAIFCALPRSLGACSSSSNSAVASVAS